MPHLRFRGIHSEQVQAVTTNLAEELAPIIGTSAENFTFELIASQFFNHGQPAEGYPFIEVLWFERPAEVKQQTAKHLTARVQRLLPKADVAVVFQPLARDNYFENGRHF